MDAKENDDSSDFKPKTNSDSHEDAHESKPSVRACSNNSSAPANDAKPFKKIRSKSGQKLLAAELSAYSSVDKTLETSGLVNVEGDDSKFDDSVASLMNQTNSSVVADDIVLSDSDEHYVGLRGQIFGQSNTPSTVRTSQVVQNVPADKASEKLIQFSAFNEHLSDVIKTLSSKIEAKKQEINLVEDATLLEGGNASSNSNKKIDEFTTLVLSELDLIEEESDISRCNTPQYTRGTILPKLGLRKTIPSKSVLDQHDVMDDEQDESTKVESDVGKEVIISDDDSDCEVIKTLLSEVETKNQEGNLAEIGLVSSNMVSSALTKEIDPNMTLVLSKSEEEEDEDDINRPDSSLEVIEEKMLPKLVDQHDVMDDEQDISTNVESNFGNEFSVGIDDFSYETTKSISRETESEDDVDHSVCNQSHEFGHEELCSPVPHASILELYDLYQDVPKIPDSGEKVTEDDEKDENGDLDFSFIFNQWTELEGARRWQCKSHWKAVENFNHLPNVLNKLADDISSPYESTPKMRPRLDLIPRLELPPTPIVEETNEDSIDSDSDERKSLQLETISTSKILEKVKKNMRRFRRN
uniref:Uncharacterized protein n=1 Tax=Panagrolaimus sp. JU765 TaxID=591449 RepID=A0AC34QSR4_9BILA